MTQLATKTAGSASAISTALDRIKYDITAIAKENNVSPVLMFVTLRQWVEDNLQSAIDDGH